MSRLLPLALVLILAACDDGGAPAEVVGRAAPTPHIRYEPADGDAFGFWSRLLLGNVSVEIPFDDRWRKQITQDPCTGDGRYIVLIEDTTNGDRLSIDLATRAVVVHPPGSGRLDPVRDRILASFQGGLAAAPPMAPEPATAVAAGCADRDPGGVPTLTPDIVAPVR
jgi:hypothetical protein